MSLKRSISGIFKKFAGREVGMTEETYTVRGKTFTQVKLDTSDPVIKEMRDEASKNGLKLRLWWPGVQGTPDARPDRVNIHIEKSDDGKWRVGKKFDIG